MWCECGTLLLWCGLVVMSVCDGDVWCGVVCVCEALLLWCGVVCVCEALLLWCGLSVWCV